MGKTSKIPINRKDKHYNILRNEIGTKVYILLLHKKLNRKQIINACMKKKDEKTVGINLNRLKKYGYINEARPPKKIILKNGRKEIFYKANLRPFIEYIQDMGLSSTKSQESLGLILMDYFDFIGKRKFTILRCWIKDGKERGEIVEWNGLLYLITISRELLKRIFQFKDDRENIKRMDRLEELDDDIPFQRLYKKFENRLDELEEPYRILNKLKEYETITLKELSLWHVDDFCNYTEC